MPRDDLFRKNEDLRDGLAKELRAIEKERSEALARLRTYPESLERDKALLEQLGKQWDIVKTFSDDLEETAHTFGIERLTEGARMAYDWFKHLTTASTGLLLLITALLKAFFPDPRWPLLVAVSLIAFLLSALASVLAMAGRADEATVTPLRGEERGTLWGSFVQDSVQDGLLYFVVGAFAVGVLTFTIFAIGNTL
jgi:hypothetical protein